MNEEVRRRWKKNIGHIVAENKRYCLVCDKVINSCTRTYSLIGGVELISYATFGSKHDYGNRDFNAKQMHFCICDECYEKAIDKAVKRQVITQADFFQPSKTKA